MGLIHGHGRKNHNKNETQEARIEDAAYMLNHAIACTFTDVFEAPLNTAFHNKFVFYLPEKVQKHVAHFKPFGCGCTGKHTADNHKGHKVEANASLMKAYAAELIADFGSVPLVLATQRYFPNQMKAVERAIEPIVSKPLHKRAELSVMNWAKNRGISYDSEAYHQEVDDIYHHELSHLPQAILWTGLSLGLHAGGQMALGINAPLLGVVSAKLISSVVVFSGVVGTRFAMPSTMRKFDQFTTKHFISPSTIAIGDIVGLDPKVVRNFVEKEEHEIAQETAFKKAQEGKRLDMEDIQAIKEAKQEGQQIMQEEMQKKSPAPNPIVQLPTIETMHNPELLSQLQVQTMAP